MKLLKHTTILILLLCSCKKDAHIEVIDSDIKIKMQETVDSTKRTLQFYCSTEKGYGCSNFGISKIVNQSAYNIDINFEAILINTFCLTSIGPATTTIDLGTLSNGTYNLDIKVGGKKNKGQLIVSSDNYAITLNDKKQLQVINSPLRRIPPTTVWGAIRYHFSSTATLVQTFIDSLLFLGATS